MAFNNLIGNEQVKQTLSKIIETKKLSHSYMFIGPSGIGKTLFAKEFAKMILCENEEKKPCGKCKSCIELLNNNNPDLIEILPQNRSNKSRRDKECLLKGIRKTNNFGKKSIYNKRCRHNDQRSL